VNEKPTIQRYHLYGKDDCGERYDALYVRNDSGEHVFYDDLAPYVKEKVDEARQQIIDEMVKPLMIELSYAGKEAGGYAKNRAEQTLAVIEAKMKE
jgi:hypothetical protein